MKDLVNYYSKELGVDWLQTTTNIYQKLELAELYNQMKLQIEAISEKHPYKRHFAANAYPSVLFCYNKLKTSFEIKTLSNGIMEFFKRNNDKFSKEGIGFSDEGLEESYCEFIFKSVK